MTNVLTVDLGAESGRVMSLQLDDNHLRLDEVHRFQNVPVKVRDTLHWDILRLWHDIQMGIGKGKVNATSVGIDTWAVDFALLDASGDLLANPVHYRDQRTLGMTEWVNERVDQRTIFKRTGIQYMSVNTLFQLASIVVKNPALFEQASYFLTIPDLINYWMTGSYVSEFTNATTTQCFNISQRDWDKQTLEILGVPTRIFPDVIEPGTLVGDYNGLKVIAPACHDTASAVAALPTTHKEVAFLSSGTWSLLGIEVKEPILTDEAYTVNVTNEGGVFGTIRLLKNVMGLWLAQQSRLSWERQGKLYTYEELTQLAIASEPFVSWVDPDDTAFLRPANMPEQIRSYCKRTGQAVPESVGQIMRTIYESLALKYRIVLDQLTSLTQKPVHALHIVGGGSQNDLLNQMTANATGIPVIAGPVEATALGNGIMQFIALGELNDLSDARALIENSFALKTFEPQDEDQWDEMVHQFNNRITS